MLIDIFIRDPESAVEPRKVERLEQKAQGPSDRLLGESDHVR